MPHLTGGPGSNGMLSSVAQAWQHAQIHTRRSLLTVVVSVFISPSFIGDLAHRSGGLHDPLMIGAT